MIAPPRMLALPTPYMSNRLAPMTFEIAVVVGSVGSRAVYATSPENSVAKQAKPTTRSRIPSPFTTWPLSSRRLNGLSVYVISSIWCECLDLKSRDLFFLPFRDLVIYRIDGSDTPLMSRLVRKGSPLNTCLVDEVVLLVSGVVLWV